MRTPAQASHPPTKSKRELTELESAFRNTPGDAALAFRLAQAYRDAGQDEKALKTFDLRATLAGFDQEVYAAMLHGARLAADRGHRQGEIIERYLSAYEFRPSRHEALGELAYYLREQGPRWQLGFLLTSRAVLLPPTGDVFDVRPEWQQWRCLDEHAVAAYWVGEYEICRQSCERLLNGGVLPATHRERVMANLNFANAKLG